MTTFLYPKQTKLQILCTLFEPKRNVIFQNNQNKDHHKWNSVQGMPKGFKNQIEEIHPRMIWVCKKKCCHKREKEKKRKKKLNEKCKKKWKEWCVCKGKPWPFPQKITWLMIFVSNFKIQKIIFEPSYHFLDNLSTLDHVTSLIKSILIKDWLL